MLILLHGHNPFGMTLRHTNHTTADNVRSNTMQNALRVCVCVFDTCMAIKPEYRIRIVNLMSRVKTVDRVDRMDRHTFRLTAYPFMLSICGCAGSINPEVDIVKAG